MSSMYPDMSKYPSVQTFKKCLRSHLYANHKIGVNPRGQFICWLRRDGEGHDVLDIFRNGPNDFAIHFNSCTGNSWKHEGCRLIDVYYAVATWDTFKEEFDKGWFEY